MPKLTQASLQLLTKMSAAFQQFLDTLKRHFLLGVIEDCSDPSTSIPNHFLKNKTNSKNRLEILTYFYYPVMT